MTEWTALPEPYTAFSMPADTDLTGPGVYWWRRSTGESYVGKATSLLSRLGDHRRAGMLTVVDDGTIFPTDTVEAADRLERALIWLLDPSENIQRPEPSPQLWAATLGRARPFYGWAWFRACGHVQIGRHSLASSDAVIGVGCNCTPWYDWLDTARAAVDGLEAQIVALTEGAVATVNSQELRQRIDGLVTAVADRDQKLVWCDEKIAELERQICNLEALRERADWTA